MNISRRLLSFVLCALILLSALTACKSTPEVPEDATLPSGSSPVADPLPEEEGNPIALIKDKVALYSVVYAESLSEEAVAAAAELRNMFVNHTGKEVTFGKDTETEESPYEILIGTTNRRASLQTRHDLARFSYIVRVVDTKIVICATNDWMIPAAINSLSQSMKAERDENKKINTLTVMDTLSVLFDYTKETKYSRDGWALSKFPPFFGGELVEKTYNKTGGFKSLSITPADYKMQIATDTDVSDFKAYANALSANGFSVTPHAKKQSTVISYWVESGKNRMYIYYTAATKEAHFIVDQNDSVALSEFEYTYEKQQGDSTTFYLYGFKMHQDGINVGEKYPSKSYTEFYETYPELLPMAGKKQETYKNCGSMFVIKLADNSVMIIDGGEYKMMCVEQAIYLNEFLHEITNTPMNEKVRISCWFITHPHGDHYTAFLRFLNGFYQYYDMERIMYNVEHPDFVAQIAAVKTWYPDIIYHKLHTGERIHIADVTFDVLFTLEDLVRVGSMTCEYWPEGTAEDKIESKKDDNDTSAVLRMTVDGKTVMLTGDIASEASKVLLRNYESNSYAELKADILQIPHHGWNNLSSFFKAVNPSYSVFNQSEGGAKKGLAGAAINTYNAAAAATKGGAANMYFAGDETVGFEVYNGKFRVCFKEDAVGYAWDGSDGGTEHHWSTGTAFPASAIPKY